MSDDLKCKGVLILSGNADETSDYAYYVVAECDDAMRSNCGFREALPEWDGDKFWFITSVEFDEIQARHLTHARR